MNPTIMRNRPLTRPTTAGAVVAGLAIAGLTAISHAQITENYENPQDRSSARLVASKTALVAGQENWIQVQFKLDDGWHLYWDGQNDTGFPPEIDIDWPEGWELRETLLPIPERHVSPGDLLDHVLEGEPVIWLMFYVPDNAAGADVTLTGKASWLVCDEACLLDDESLSLTIPVLPSGSKGERNPEAVSGPTLWKAFPEPSKLAIPGWLDAKWSGDEVRLRVRGETKEEWKPGSALEYYPAEDSARVQNLLVGGRSEDGELTLRIGDGEAPGTPALRGVVALIRPDGHRTAMWITMNRPGKGP